MARTTKVMVQRAFQRLIDHIGGETYDGIYASREGKYFLEYTPYVGYQVRQFDDKGECQPFGSVSYTADEFWNSVYMVTHAFEQAAMNRDERG